MSRALAVLAVFAAMALASLLLGCASTTSPTEAHPRAATEWSHVRTELALRNAQTAVRRGDLAAAKRDLIQAVDRGAEDARLHVLLARIAIEEGRLDAAQMRLDLAADLDPSLPAVALTRGLVLEIRGHWSAAARAYERATARFPEDERLRVARLRALQAAGEDQAAERVLVAGGGAEARSSDLLTLLGNRALAAGRPRAARTYFERALRVEPDAVAALDGRVKALYALGEHDAVVAALRGRVRETDDGSMRLLLARSALVAGSLDVAVRMLQGHVQQHAGDADAWVDLARAYFLLDRPGAVQEALGEALRLQPDMGAALVLRGHLAWREARWQDALLQYECAAAAQGPVDRAQLARLIAAARQRAAPARAPARPVVPSTPSVGTAAGPTVGSARVRAPTFVPPLAAVNAIDWTYHGQGRRR